MLIQPKLVDDGPAETGEGRDKTFKPLDVYGDWISGDYNHVRENGLWDMKKLQQDQIRAWVPLRYRRDIITTVKELDNTLETMLMWKYTPSFNTMIRFVGMIDRSLNG